MAPKLSELSAQELQDLAKIKGGTCVVYYLNDPGDAHNIILYNKFPREVLAAFSREWGDLNKRGKLFSMDIVAWPQWVVKTVFNWMLKCCSGVGVDKEGNESREVKDILKFPKADTIEAKKASGEAFGNFFKLAFILDFAEEYGMQFLEMKIKDELKFLSSKFPVRGEEVYDMCNYFWQDGRDTYAYDTMVNSIARAYVEKDDKPKGKTYYEAQRMEWPDFNEALATAIEQNRNSIDEDPASGNNDSKPTGENGSEQPETQPSGDWDNDTPTVSGDWADQVIEENAGNGAWPEKDKSVSTQWDFTPTPVPSTGW